MSTSSTFAQRLRSGVAELQLVMHSRQVSVVQTQFPTYSIDPDESISSMTAGRISRMSGWATAGDAPGKRPASRSATGTHAIGDAAPQLRWVGYLSTTGVYGDHGGEWVDEATPLTPSTKRGHHRVTAEAQWQAQPLPLHIFRLAGIYGPGRGPFAKVRAGTARRIVKPNQVFSRIHVDDIAQVLLASIDRPNPGAIYNVCDDEAAPPEEVLAHAAALLGVELPPEEDYATAEMTPMARSFYAESKRVRNSRMKEELGVELRYPSYRDGLRALLAEEA